jgi:hypothetical protein
MKPLCSALVIVAVSGPAWAQENTVVAQGDTVPLRVYLDDKIVALDRRYDERLIGIERATTIALATLNARLEGMNEFRAALKDQVFTFANKDATDARLGLLESKTAAFANKSDVNAQIVTLKDDLYARTAALENKNAFNEGKAAMFGVVGGVVAGVLTAVVAAFIGRRAA